MRQAHARKSFDAYLDAPRRADRPHLHVVADLRDEVPGIRIPEPDPAVEQPQWAEAFLDPRWDDELGRDDVEIRDGRRTVLVTGRPGAQHRPIRDTSSVATARQRRHTPTRARLAGRPDRVALWAVALGLIMAAMAGFTGGAGSHGHSQNAAPAAPAPVFDR